MKQFKGAKFVCALPDGYDERTQMTTFNGYIVVAHPDFPPCILEDGKLVPIEPTGTGVAVGHVTW